MTCSQCRTSVPPSGGLCAMCGSQPAISAKLAVDKKVVAIFAGLAVGMVLGVVADFAISLTFGMIVAVGGHAHDLFIDSMANCGPYAHRMLVPSAVIGAAVGSKLGAERSRR